jgi:hypothetical protein
MLGIRGAVWRRIAVTAIIFVAFLRAIAGGASAQEPEPPPEPPTPTLSVTPSSGPPGTTVTISGTGCVIAPDPGVPDVVESVNLRIRTSGGTVLDEPTVQIVVDGAWSFSYTVPEGVPIGETLKIEATCVGNSALAAGTATFGVELIDAPPATTTTTTGATNPLPAPPTGGETPSPDGSAAGADGRSPDDPSARANGSSSDDSSDGSSDLVPTADPATPAIGDPDYTG